MEDYHFIERSGNCFFCVKTNKGGIKIRFPQEMKGGVREREISIRFVPGRVYGQKF